MLTLKLERNEWREFFFLMASKPALSNLLTSLTLGHYPDVLNIAVHHNLLSCSPSSPPPPSWGYSVPEQACWAGGINCGAVHQHFSTEHCKGCSGLPQPSHPTPFSRYFTAFCRFGMRERPGK